MEEEVDSECFISLFVQRIALWDKRVSESVPVT